MKTQIKIVAAAILATGLAHHIPPATYLSSLTFTVQ